MSFVGNRLEYAQRDPRKETILTPDSLESKRKQAREKFAQFQADRKSKPALAGIARGEESLNTCACGQYKRQSASHCYTCADERAALHREFQTTTDFATAKKCHNKMRLWDNDIKRMPPPLSYKSIAITDYDESVLDELVNICEENLSKLD